MIFSNAIPRPAMKNKKKIRDTLKALERRCFLLGVRAEKEGSVEMADCMWVASDNIKQARHSIKNNNETIRN